MATKKITELVEIISAANDDVLPIVDISTDITNKIKVENLPISTSVQTALNGKENTIGYTTENVANKSTSVTTDQASNTKYPSVKAVYDWAVGLFATLSQLATKQDTLVSGTNIKTVNSTSLLGSGNVSVQETLVSGTNIRTINSTSLLGSGDISIQANPSGVSGAIQFSNGSAFASDATNLFWDNTNKRLGVGTNTGLIAQAHFQSNTSLANEIFVGSRVATSGTRYDGLRIGTNNNAVGFIQGNSGINLTSAYPIILQPNGSDVGIGMSTGTITARLQVRGSGSTSATTALLVQNSAGTELFRVRDDQQTIMRGTVILLGLFNNDYISIGLNRIYGNNIGLGALTFNANNISYSDTGSVAGVASSCFNIDSTTRGFLPPRMTTTQKNAISSPAAGLQVYDTTLNQMSYYNGSSWINF